MTILGGMLLAGAWLAALAAGPPQHAYRPPPAFVNPRPAPRPAFVATPRSPAHDEATLPPVRYEGSRRLTRFLDLTMNNSPYPGDHWQTPNASTGPLQAWYANVTKGVTARAFADIAATLHCDAWEYDVMNDGSGSDGGNGHTAFFSPTGPIFPQLREKDCDFFGELSSELKARGMEVFVYMPIAYNHYFAAEHPEAGWLYRNKTSGRIPRPLNISCLNYPVSHHDTSTFFPRVPAISFTTIRFVTGLHRARRQLHAAGHPAVRAGGGALRRLADDDRPPLRRLQALLPRALRRGAPADLEARGLAPAV